MYMQLNVLLNLLAGLFVLCVQFFPDKSCQSDLKNFQVKLSLWMAGQPTGENE